MQNVNTSICPAGWTLPTELVYSTLLFSDPNASNESLSRLYRSYPNNFILSGEANSTGSDFTNHKPGGTYFGGYWTATNGDSYYPGRAYRMSVNLGGISLSSSNSSDATYFHSGTDKSNHLAVRCVLTP